MPAASDPAPLSCQALNGAFSPGLVGRGSDYFHFAGEENEAQERVGAGPRSPCQGAMEAGLRSINSEPMFLGWATWLGWGWARREPYLSGSFHVPGTRLDIFCISGHITLHCCSGCGVIVLSPAQGIEATHPGHREVGQAAVSPFGSLHTQELVLQESGPWCSRPPGACTFLPPNPLSRQAPVSSCAAP